MTTNNSPRRLAIQLLRTADALEDRLDFGIKHAAWRIEECHVVARNYAAQARRADALAADAAR